jgi:hypothetical protein
MMERRVRRAHPNDTDTGHSATVDHQIMRRLPITVRKIDEIIFMRLIRRVDISQASNR